jgi:AcrR family transcriptional regulator
MTARDPLFDTLFRPTAPASEITSAAPVRAAGTRSRAGNAMNRTRAALLEGARRSVESSGTKITMAQIAAAAGVAKATLYNHFRTREAVLAALLTEEVTRLVDELSGRPLAEALSSAANAVASHPLVRVLARIEPATVAALSCIDLTAEGWRTARDGVEVALAAESRGGTDTVLRWLASYLLTPGTPQSICAGVAAVVAGLPAAKAAQTPRDTPAGPRAAQPA